MIQLKKLLLMLLILFLGVAVADDVSGAPVDGESVLIIYTDASIDPKPSEDLVKAFEDAFNDMPNPPVITSLIISAGDGSAPGFYDELVAQTGQTELSDWCQVYDLRFREDKNNQGWTGNEKQEDVLTMLGDNSDWELFDNYLDAGGHIYFQSDHHDFYIRNTNLLMFINHIALAPITQANASFESNVQTISNFPSDPMDFNTDFNNISGQSMQSRFPGGIDVVNAGSGRPLGTFAGGATAMALAYLSEDLKRNDGRVVINFETNALYEDEGDEALVSATTTAWIQNVYDLLSGCYRYTLEKEFIPDTLMQGEEGKFDISYTNEMQPLKNFTVTDTIPDCLEFISSSPAPSGNNDNVYWWDLPEVSSGGSGTISVDYKLTKLPPCN
jgi:hypothetical protein